MSDPDSLVLDEGPGVQIRAILLHQDDNPSVHMLRFEVYPLELSKAELETLMNAVSQTVAGVLHHLGVGSDQLIPIPLVPPGSKTH